MSTSNSAGGPETDQAVKRVEKSPKERLGKSDVTVVSVPSLALVETNNLGRIDDPYTGRVVVVKPDYPAGWLVKERDIAGGISIYPIRNMEKKNKSSDKKALREKFAEMSVAVGSDDTPFFDYSKHQKIHTVLTNERNSLGDESCYVSIAYLPKNNKSDFHYALVVKSYDREKSNRIHAIMRDYPDISIADLHAQGVFDEAKRYGSSTRNIVASSVARHMGLEIQEHAPGKLSKADRDIVSMAIPEYECVYNTVEKNEGLDPKGKRAFVYYNNCYNLKDCKGGIIMGTPDGVDMKILLCKKKSGSSTWYCPASFDGFPMSFPVSGVEGSEVNMRPENVYWGGCLDFNTLLGSTRVNYRELEGRPWAEKLERMGYDHKDGQISITRLASYVSSPCEVDTKLYDTVRLTRESVVTIPANHVSLLAMLENYTLLAKRYELRLSNYFNDSKPGYVRVTIENLASLVEYMQELGIVV